MKINICFFLHLHNGVNMVWLLKERWFWVIIGSLILVLALPLTIIWLVLNLPPTIRLIVTIAIILAWGIAAGYKDWLIAKRQEENKKES
jgi:hypothetical protein